MNRYLAEALGTAFLLGTVIGSGIMAENLSGGNVALALLGNTIPTGAILFVLITVLGPVSGAHFNPAVTLAFWIRKEISGRDARAYVLMQIAGGLIGTWLAHAMFELPILHMSEKLRPGLSQGLSEVIACFGLVLVILVGLRVRKDAIPALVGFYITAAYWFTASTSFANPAVTIARAFSDTFAGIHYSNVPMFIAAQIVGAVLAVQVARLLLTAPVTSPTE